MKTTCCIVGGGPAGVMLGYLLARAGIDVVVLEKHTDFFRDFRGDTIHPSTMQLMDELGLLDDFLKCPHEETRQLKGFVSGEPVTLADFTHLPTRCKFMAFMPQWDFLNFLSSKAKAWPHFKLLMATEAKGLIVEGSNIIGVTAQMQNEKLDIYADLVVGADGRHSIVRDKANLMPDELGAPMDILWMRMSKRAGDPDASGGRITNGKMLAMIDRGTYWQCAYVIAKGGIDKIKAEGLDRFREAIVSIAPMFANRVDELKSWDDIKLLTVAVNRLQQWYKPGLLCIGDCAHAMSPIGGVGINLAVQDAVAAANILAHPLKTRTLKIGNLLAVQRRREWPTRMTQGLQILIQKNVITSILAGGGGKGLPWQLKLVRIFPILQRIPARLIGMGFRPEHIQMKDTA